MTIRIPKSIYLYKATIGTNEVYGMHVPSDDATIVGQESKKLLISQVKSYAKEYKSPLIPVNDIPDKPVSGIEYKSIPTEEFKKLSDELMRALSGL